MIRDIFPRIPARNRSETSGDGKGVFAAGADGRGRFTAEDKLVREVLMENGVLPRRAAPAFALIVQAGRIDYHGKGLPALALSMALMVGRVASSSCTKSLSSFAMAAPAAPFPCSGISLPMLHMMTDG